MNVDVIQEGKRKILEGRPGFLLLTADRHAVDLVGYCGEAETDAILLHGYNLPEAFFDLRTGLAGAVMQKFQNYGVRMAAVLEPGQMNSRRFREMAGESNRMGSIGFFVSREEALSWL